MADQLLPAVSLDAIAGAERRTNARANSNTRDSRSSSSSASPAPAEYEESDFFLGANDSQSSLGVPNIQEMQVADDECSPPIMRLPNEILMNIFSKFASPPDLPDLLNCMLTCKRWARNSVDLLWHRPACTEWERHEQICRTLTANNPFFHYAAFVKRLNVSLLADKINDGSVLSLANCNRVERLTMNGCKGLTDTGVIALVTDSSHLLALDISEDKEVTEASIYALAENCPRLQGLNITKCVKISNESLITLARSCRYLKRLKLNECPQVTDEAVMAFAENCPNILELDLQSCRQIGNAPISMLLTNGHALRELRLANCSLIDDGAFLSLPSHRTTEHLRILDLTLCTEITDRAIEKIIDAAPRIRNLVLAKCKNITDRAIYSIAALGKNLHYVHLGHCANITDDAVKHLVENCNRIRYIDLGCCHRLTDDSVTKLASLPKLKRIGLVKCVNITDESVYALARAHMKSRPQKEDGRIVYRTVIGQSSLERVHLSYCTSLTIRSILRLLNACSRLTHLSLTGVQAFLRPDLEPFCRDAPPEFTDNQRNVFCVFSGDRVKDLRKHLSNDPAFHEIRKLEHLAGYPVPQTPASRRGIGGGEFGEADVIDEYDGDDGREMMDELLVPHPVGPPIHGSQALTGHINHGVPPPPPPHPIANGYPSWAPPQTQFMTELLFPQAAAAAAAAAGGGVGGGRQTPSPAWAVGRSVATADAMSIVQQQPHQQQQQQQQYQQSPSSFFVGMPSSASALGPTWQQAGPSSASTATLGRGVAGSGSTNSLAMGLDQHNQPGPSQANLVWRLDPRSSPFSSNRGREGAETGPASNTDVDIESP